MRTDLNGIQILPAGHKHEQPTELLASIRMGEIMRELAMRYPDRIIVLDSPPLLATSEAHAVARHAGQIVFVIECEKTTSSEIQESLRLIDQTKPINIILNKSRYTQAGGHYGGGYGYSGFNEA